MIDSQEESQKQSQRGPGELSIQFMHAHHDAKLRVYEDGVWHSDEKRNRFIPQQAYHWQLLLA
eukprot:487792-Pelagomonas_calceolata.AAC.3